MTTVRFAIVLLLFGIPVAAQTTINDIDQSSGWYQPGTSTSNFCTGTACAGGNSDANLSWMAQGVTTFTLDTASQEFHVGGNSGGYGNGRWWADFDAQSNATTFDLNFSIYTDANFAAVAQAIQFGVEQDTSGGRYKAEVQCDFLGGSGVWRFFDAQTGAWQNTNRACVAFTSGWNHFVFHFVRTSCPAGFASATGQCSQWTSVNINNTNYPITRPDGSGMYGRPSMDGGSDLLRVIVQLNGNANENPYEVYMDSVSLTTNTSSGGNGLPTPPPNAAAFPNLQNQTGNPGTWTVCNGTCAGSNGSGTSSLTFGHTSPSLSNASMAMTSSGSNFWNTMYFRHLGCPSIGCAAVKNMLEDMWFNPVSVADVEQLEFDPDLFNAGWKYFGSIACRLKGTNAGFWHFWNSAGDTWVASSFPCTASTIAPGAWHHLQLYVTFDTSTHTYAYQTFVFDGTTVFQNAGITYSALNLNNTFTNVNIEQQIDNDVNTSTNTVYYDNYNLWVW